jgi:hypothetical protein
MKKFLWVILVLIFMTSNSYADWKVEKEKSFKGEVNIYLTSKAKDGSLLWIDVQKKYVVYNNSEKILNGIRGIKIDGEYFDVLSSSGGDSHNFISFCSQFLNDGCYEKIINAKVVEINVDYYRSSMRVSTFSIHALAGTVAKYYFKIDE